MFDRSGRQKAEEGMLGQMLAQLRHRGPDEFGILLDGPVGLGNARLSIIDLSGGSQPIANEDESLWIVFNGEIFNYLELRASLVTSGHRFRTGSDTEVILHLFEELGPACLDKLNGQFAIAIWDRRLRSLFLARDRLGVRPLFYTELAGRTLLFGSEIKALLSHLLVRAELDPAVVEQVFRFWSPIGPNTAFRGIKELPPGHYLLADAMSVRVRCYWQNRFPMASDGDGVAPGAQSSSSARTGALDHAELELCAPTPKEEQEVIENFQSLLIDACRLRLRADVPVGAYLSGGLDSSTIAAVIRRHFTNRLATFSIAFTDEQFDESRFQLEMAAHLGTDHHVVRAAPADVGRVFPNVIWHAESPMMRTAPAPMYLLSQLVRQHGFKVVLTGEGADEFLGGYDIFKEDKIRRFWARLPGSGLRPRLLQHLYPDIANLSRTGPAFLAAFFGAGVKDVHSPWYSHAVRWANNRRVCRFFQDDLLPPGSEAVHLERLAANLPPEFGRWSPLARAQHLEIILFLSHYLLSSQGDRMSMANSVEGRFPFLDYRLVEFCNRLQPRLKLRALTEKYLLKAAARPYLPDAIRRRRKRPYRAPIHRSFFSGSAPDYVRELLSAAALRETGLFKPRAVEGLVAKIRSGGLVGETDDMALVGILSTQLLHHQFIKAFRPAPPLSKTDRVKLLVLDSRRSDTPARPFAMV